MMTRVIALPAFVDNYIWMIERAGYAAVVDPGDAAPVLRALEAAKLPLAAILITHHHADHVGGIAKIVQAHPVPVFGPRAESSTIPGLTQLLVDGDRIEVPKLGLPLSILSVPGHTLGHIAYYAEREGQQPPRLFCGDTMFSAGCGRLFEGTAEQLHHSLAKLNGFDADTEIYCTHEYTLSNLAFASAVEPGNADVARHRDDVRALRDRGEPSLPSRLSLERRVNPFLRTGEAAIMRAAAGKLGRPPADAVEVFATLRRWKDGFRAP
ncbi:MAG TPA: hydroxyacylglutathione hydrolase [Nevskiaceae bacterium]|nr:hydroxyacylglutathione hydrolase [Nevskiaceae bacterium]